MNTDMNQYLIFNKCIGMLINYCKKNDSLSAESLVLGKLTRHLCLQSTFLVVIPWVPRVRAFCSDIPRSNHGITILYPKSSSH